MRGHGAECPELFPGVLFDLIFLYKMDLRMLCLNVALISGDLVFLENSEFFLMPGKMYRHVFVPCMKVQNSFSKL
jgi:hypothetical protein